MKSINAMCLVFLSIAAGCAGEVVDDPPVESTKQELRAGGAGGDSCESTLASCMNHGGDTSVLELAQSSVGGGRDRQARSEFVELVNVARSLPQP